jgi:class 3 adenylate cyclase
VILLRDYFKNAAFAKPNGDGLLMNFQHDDENLKPVSADIWDNCFEALKDFPTMFKGVPLINYETPAAIGFGIARGSASFLEPDNEKLDYSGKLLNLAARLMEFARPQGMVVVAITGWNSSWNRS